MLTYDCGSGIEIHSERLTMIPATDADVDVLHRIWRDPDVRKYLWDDIEIDTPQAREVVADGVRAFATERLGYWLVRLPASNDVIGFCGLRRFGEGFERVEVLYGLLPGYWRRGFATEATRAVLHWGFTHCGLNEIYAGADPPNTASFHVMERLGMERAFTTRIHDLEAIYYVMKRERFTDPVECRIVWGDVHGT
jgi:[ribosomal protein S5]-alanine N-acetyltransferase